jgi:GH15 family glucan-1,4-alpha-glucosidase
VPCWQREADAIRDFVETECWSEELGTYTDVAGGTDLDASLLLMIRCPWQPSPDERELAMLETVRDRLADGPLLYRSEQLREVENAFVPCTFWLVEALSRAGRLDEAAALMDEGVQLANDVGLLAEEIEPATGDFYGNFPQGLSHLALVNAAVVFREACEDAARPPSSGARATSREPGR